ncbi:hypothetical protein [Larkinella soli]|uniref:hypothetical protein n=1 Tax=Larkinella soli TaxID=1770527 RepID=UPI000FFB496D|nr:hypothetical protein [Larkinella soli]
MKTELETRIAAEDTELVSTRLPRLHPDIVRNQSGAAMEDDEEDTVDEDETENEEPTDDDGDPTGEHDHQLDDNYYLGGNVARSSGE